MLARYLLGVAGWQSFFTGRTCKNTVGFCCAHIHVHTYIPGVSTFLCKASRCLLRKQLNLPQPHDLPARPRGVHPQNDGRLLRGRGVCSHFCFDMTRLRVLPVFVKNGPPGVRNDRTVYSRRFCGNANTINNWRTSNMFQPSYAHIYKLNLYLAYFGEHRR